LAGSVERFERMLAEEGLAGRVVRLEENTRTAELAAQALGTAVGAIVKSLVVLADGRPSLVMVAGDRRADLAQVARLLGAEQVHMARGAQVKEITGFAIGGVPPLLEDQAGARLPAIMDRQLGRFAEVWAAAGSPYAVFPIAPAELERLAGATVEDFTGDLDG
jgi:prolyl-tRNA editing enzyme YbaK/EbsC (Cys-tRNA(Pro) deacylase)